MSKHQKTKMAIPSKYFYISPGQCNRINDMLNVNMITLPTNFETKLKNIIMLLNVSKSNDTHEKFKTILSQIEQNLLKQSKYNIVIKNLPDYAICSATDERSRLNYESFRDTIKQFSKVNDIYIKYSVSYLNLDNPEYVHNTLNKMQLGKNIIETILC